MLLTDTDMYLPVPKTIPLDQYEPGWLGDIAAVLFEVIDVPFDNIPSRHFFEIRI